MDFERRTRLLVKLAEDDDETRIAKIRDQAKAWKTMNAARQAKNMETRRVRLANSPNPIQTKGGIRGESYKYTSRRDIAEADKVIPASSRGEGRRVMVPTTDPTREKRTSKLAPTGGYTPPPTKRLGHLSKRRARRRVERLDASLPRRRAASLRVKTQDSGIFGAAQAQMRSVMQPRSNMYKNSKHLSGMTDKAAGEFEEGSYQSPRKFSRDRKDDAQMTADLKSQGYKPDGS